MDREGVTIRDLLAHSSGLAAYLPFFRDHTARREFQHAICTMPLEYAPRTQSIYSDLGFILLGFILEDAASVSAGYSGYRRILRSGRVTVGAISALFDVRHERTADVQPTTCVA